MTLPNDVNEQVAEACGLKLERGRGKWVDDVTSSPFHPDTDPAAALFAVKAYAMLTGWDIHINILGESNSIFDGLFEVCVDEQSAHYDDDFCQAVCAMILEAEKGRMK